MDLRNDPRSRRAAWTVLALALIAIVLIVTCTGCGASQAMDDLVAVEKRIASLEQKLDRYIALGHEKDAEVAAMCEEIRLALEALRRYQARIAMESP